MSEVIGINIQSGRHLVVEQVIESSFVPNDIELNTSTQMLLITGPNMGGKSTFMRQTALITLLACTGSFVPAESAMIGPIDRIFTRIGASDDLAGGRSTFMVEMTETANILNNATQNSLVLMDEIGRGTSTFDGLSLAWAVASHIASKIHALTLFATHYFELTQLENDTPTVKNAHLTAVEHNDKIVFMYKVEPGHANQSYGLHVAKLAGIPQSVIHEAKEKLHQLETSNHIPHADLNKSVQTVTKESTHPCIEKLLALDPNEFSPKEALEKLFELKEDC